MEDYTGLKNSDSEFLSSGSMRVNLTFDGRRNDMMMSEMVRTSLSIFAVLQLGFWAGRIERRHNRISNDMTVHICKVPGGSEFDKEDDHGCGHGNRTRGSSICRNPEIRKTRIGQRLKGAGQHLECQLRRFGI